MYLYIHIDMNDPISMTMTSVTVIRLRMYYTCYFMFYELSNSHCSYSNKNQ